MFYLFELIHSSRKIAGTSLLIEKILETCFQHFLELGHWHSGINIAIKSFSTIYNGIMNF